MPAPSKKPKLYFATCVGARETPVDVLPKLTALGAQLRAAKAAGRTGHAKGADQAFETGLQERVACYVPWASYNREDAHQKGRDPCVFDKLSDTLQMNALEIAATLHPAWRFVKREHYPIFGRNVMQVLGSDVNNPVPSDCLLCWGEPDGASHGKVKGGTGFTVAVARAYDIPVFNLHEVPFDQVEHWLTLSLKHFSEGDICPAPGPALGRPSGGTA